jgi:hypothetical protein
MFAGSRESAVSRIRRDISGQKTLLPIFFPSRWLRVLKPLPKGTKFDQGYFVDAIFPGLYNEKRRISREDGFPAFSAHLHIRRAVIATRSPRNLPREALNKLHTHLILQI